jgi:ferredoxin
MSSRTDATEKQGDSNSSNARVPDNVVMRHNGRVHTLKYYAGETLLETARRGGVPLNSNCERGECGTCMVTILVGAVSMHTNQVLSEQDLKEGLVLGCQSVPISDTIEIELP